MSSPAFTARPRWVSVSLHNLLRRGGWRGGGRIRRAVPRHQTVARLRHMGLLVGRERPL